MTTITTVGLGDITPNNSKEIIFCTVFIVMGTGFYSYAIGSISSILGHSDSKAEKLYNSKQLMDEFCKETKLP